MTLTVRHCHPARSPHTGTHPPHTPSAPHLPLPGLPPPAAAPPTVAAVISSTHNIGAGTAGQVRVPAQVPAVVVSVRTHAWEAVVVSLGSAGLSLAMTAARVITYQLTTGWRADSSSSPQSRRRAVTPSLRTRVGSHHLKGFITSTADSPQLCFKLQETRVILSPSCSLPFLPPLTEALTRADDVLSDSIGFHQHWGFICMPPFSCIK